MQHIGLVLEGGGVKGAYQAGVFKALAEFNVQFDGVAGTSIGAVNGALYLQGGYQKIESVWKTVKLNTVFDFTDDEIEKVLDLQVAPAVIEYFKRRVSEKGSLIEKSYLKSQEFFKNSVDETAIRNSGKDFGVVTFNISDFKPVEIMMSQIDDGSLADFVIASATFPIFPPKVIDGKKYIDGGVYDNMPINLLARNGYNKILVIRTNPMTKKPKRPIERDGLDIYYIAPIEDLGKAMAFSSTRVKKFMEMGYADAFSLWNAGLKEFLQDDEGCYQAVAQ